MRVLSVSVFLSLGLARVLPSSILDLLEYPPTDEGRCKVGISFEGLEAAIGEHQDFMSSGGASYYNPDSPKGFLYHLAFTWTDPDCNHDRYGCSGFGCDHFECSEEQKQLANGKWAVIGDGGWDDVEVLAICEEGCPDWKGDCKHQYHVKSGPPLNCPMWPADWSSNQVWRVLKPLHGGAPKTVSQVSSTCCKRQPQQCDACAKDTCSDLISLLYNACPPNGASIFHGQTELQKACCKEYHSSLVPYPVCGCDHVPTRCAH